jgi:hypothetical protein
MYVECLKTSSNCGEVFEKKKYCISGHPKNVAHQLIIYSYSRETILKKYTVDVT